MLYIIVKYTREMLNNLLSLFINYIQQNKEIKALLQLPEHLSSPPDF